MPSSDPPIPIVPDAGLGAGSLTWTLVSGSLGRFVDTTTSTNYYLSAVGFLTVGDLNWKLDTTAPTGGNVECLFTSTVGDALKNGTVNRGAGTITYNLHTYKVPMYWNGSQMTAVLE